MVDSASDMRFRGAQAHSGPSQVKDCTDAKDLRRGVARLLAQMGYATLSEFRLGNGRRADLAGLDRNGQLILVELKVSVADLRGDTKWPSYLEYCDAFFFGVPTGFQLDIFDGAQFLPERTGLLVGDGFGAALVRSAPVEKVSAARRKAETLRFGRKAAARLQALHDPGQSQQMTPMGQLRI